MTVLFFAIIQWSPQSPGSKAGFIPSPPPPLHYIFWEWYAFKFLFMSFLLFLCSCFSHGLEVMSASDSLICFTWLLLICCHLRKTNYIRIIWKVRVIILWIQFRKPLIWVRCITFSVWSLVSHPLSDYFLILANIQSQSQLVGNPKPWLITRCQGGKGMSDPN